MPLHSNFAPCLGCVKIMNKYPGFSSELRIWFQAVQLLHPELHCSEAGRGYTDQEAAFHRNATKSHYGESAHSYNAAIDVFFMIDGKYDLDQNIFEKVIVPHLYPALNWFGAPGSKFKERPHIELKDWERMAKDGKLKLVENHIS